MQKILAALALVNVPLGLIGGELLAPLAIVQFGGILGATVLNLVVMSVAAKLVIGSGREA